MHIIRRFYELSQRLAQEERRINNPFDTDQRKLDELYILVELGLVNLESLQSVKYTELH